jgi:hypothetical protein
MAALVRSMSALPPKVDIRERSFDLLNHLVDIRAHDAGSLVAAGRLSPWGSPGCLSNDLGLVQYRSTSGSDGDVCDVAYLPYWFSQVLRTLN